MVNFEKQHLENKFQSIKSFYMFIVNIIKNSNFCRNLDFLVSRWRLNLKLFKTVELVLHYVTSYYLKPFLCLENQLQYRL